MKIEKTTLKTLTAIICVVALIIPLSSCKPKPTVSNSSTVNMSTDINDIIYGSSSDNSNSDNSNSDNSNSSSMNSDSLNSDSFNSSSVGSATINSSIRSSTAISAAGTGSKELYSTDAFKKFSPTIQMFVGQFIGGDDNYPAGQTPNNNEMYKLVEKHIGIKFIPMFTAPWGAPFNTKIKAQIASNNIPDLSFCQPDDLNLLAKGNMAENLTPYIQKYASPNLKTLLSSNGGGALLGGTFGGKVFGIPKLADSGNGVSMLYIRKDYMEKAKVAAPKSLEDLIAIAKAFKAQGLTTIGIPMTNSLGDPYNALMNAYGAHPAIMLKDSAGKYIYTSILQSTKTALGKISELVKQGIVDPNFATKNSGTSLGEVMAGKAGIYIGAFWHPLTLSDTAGLTVNGVDWNVYPMPKSGGGIIAPYTPTNIDGGYFYVKKGYKNPQALIILLNYMVEGMYNQNSKLQYIVDCTTFVSSSAVKNINTQSWLPVMVDRPDKNIQFSINIRNAIQTKSTATLTAPELVLYEQCISGKKEDWAMKTIYLYCEPALQQYTQKVYNAYNYTPTKTMNSKGGYLGGKEVQMFTAIMAGTESLSTFETFVSTWTNNGGKDILAEVNG